MIAVYLRADKYVDSINRKVTDILTLLGAIGGLKEFFLMLGSWFVTYWA